MKAYKDWKLRSKILFAAVVPFVIAVVITMPFLTNKAIENIEEKAKEYTVQLTESNALKITSQLENTASELRLFAGVVESLAVQNNSSREALLDIMYNVADKNQKIFGLWMVLDESAFSTKNEEFINRRGHSPTGEFVPYWTRERGDLELRALRDYNDPQKGRYNILPRITKKELMLTPYQYTQKSEQITITTIAQPIFDSVGNIIGVIGMDLDIRNIQETVSNIKPFDLGDAFLLDEDGSIIVDASGEKIGNKVLEDGYWMHIRKFLEKGENFTADSFDASKRQTFKVVYPVKIENVDSTWGLMVTLPLNPIKANLYKYLSLMLIIVGVCFLMGISVSIVTAKNIATPIANISNALEEISKGKADVTIPDVDSADEIGQMTSSAHVFRASAYELVAAKQKAEEANHAKTEFLANMSHELRTPMHAMLSYSKLGLEKCDDIESKIFKYFRNISNSGERLLILLNNLLDLSKLEAGKVDFRFEQNDIVEVINQVVTELNSLITGKGLSVNIVNDIANNRIQFDKFTMIQVLINIVSNAIKFSPNGGVINVRLTDTISDGRQAVIIAVEDQGIGIPENELDLIFDKFTQSSKTNKGSGGTGLGLSIAQSIINAHHGKIWAENGESVGAIIKIMLFKEIMELN